MSSDRYLSEKIRKYQKRLDRLHRKRRARNDHSNSRSRSRSRRRSSSQYSPPPLDLAMDPQDNLHEDYLGAENPANAESELEGAQQMISTNTKHSTDDEAIVEDNSDPLAAYREALGVEYEDSSKFEGNIQPEIANRWNHILVNGLTKDERDSLLKKHKLPENCQLLEAPILNEEVKAVLTENSKIRDRSIEVMQYQLGTVTAIIGKVMSDLIQNKDTDKVKAIAALSDATKLSNDIHFHNTKTRRLLISPLLDKNFNNLIEKVKRDENLYGNDLTAKIKTNHELKKSSSHIKKNVPKPGPSRPTTVPRLSSYVNKVTGNRQGPPPTQPSQQARSTAYRGGPKSRTTFQQRAGQSQTRPERAATRGARSRR